MPPDGGASRRTPGSGPAADALADWPRNTAEAAVVQERLRRQVSLEDEAGDIVLAAGIDCGYAPKKGRMRCAVAVLDLKRGEIVETAAAETAVPFPYIPGYLSFREVPAALAALGKLSLAPDLLVCDGQGIAHPKRFGLACHLGVVTGFPAVGCAKSRLIGLFDPPGTARGSTSPLLHRGEVVGAVVRTRAGVKPLFVSPGHRLSIEAAVALTLRLARRYRLPETTRAAHNLASNTSWA